MPGDVNEQDRRENEFSLQRAWRIQSPYTLRNGTLMDVSPIATK